MREMTTPKTAPNEVSDIGEKKYLDNLTRAASDQAKSRSEPIDRVRKKIAFQLLLSGLATAAGTAYIPRSATRSESNLGSCALPRTSTSPPEF